MAIALASPERISDSSAASSQTPFDSALDKRLSLLSEVRLGIRPGLLPQRPSVSQLVAYLWQTQPATGYRFREPGCRETITAFPCIRQAIRMSGSSSVSRRDEKTLNHEGPEDSRRSCFSLLSLV